MEVKKTDCWNCSATGLGQADGQVCSVCLGLGYIEEECYDDDDGEEREE